MAKLEVELCVLNRQGITHLQHLSDLLSKSKDHEVHAFIY